MPMCYLPWFLFLYWFCNVGDDSPSADALRADRLLPEDTILLIEADSVGRVFQMIANVRERAAIQGRNSAGVAWVGLSLRPNLSGGMGGINNPRHVPTPKKYEGEWPFQLSGAEASQFKLDRSFFKRFSKLTNQDIASFPGFYNEVLNGSGFYALVKLSREEYSYVFRIKLDANASLQKLLESEQLRLGGGLGERESSEKTVVNTIASSGLCWFIHNGFLYGTGNAQLARTLVRRLEEQGDFADCLARNRLYQRLHVHSNNVSPDLRLFVDSLELAKYRDKWWSKFYLPEQLLYVNVEPLSAIPRPGHILKANFADDYSIEISVTEGWSVPSAQAFFTSSDLSDGYQVPSEIPEDADGMVVFGEHPLGQGMYPEYHPYSIGEHYPPFSGVCFFKSSAEIKYKAYSWKHHMTPSRFDPEFGGNNLLEGFSIDDVDTDAAFDASRSNNKAVAAPGFSFSRLSDDWYFILADYKTRAALKTKIMNREADNKRNFDIKFINSRLKCSSGKMPFFVEAGRVPEGRFLIPGAPWGGWSYLLGLPPSDDFYQFGTPFDERHFQYSGLLMTKDELLVNQKAESLDWLSDFWFRVRFNCFPYASYFVAKNPPIIYSFNYLDRPAGILHKEIRIEFRKPD